ncbi:MAG: phosphatidylglycerophosphatase A [Planctomycetes bacterium]|nr:phosphatidylglycerophosphatase A [Planctomycetota bacterium]MCB9936400.1 phosphatidylglycerophosphatase A [Planctomycetota bacterium]
MAFFKETDPPRERLFSWPVALGSLCYSGFAPRARGTVGTAVCLLAALALLHLTDWSLSAWMPLAAVFTALSLLAGAAVIRTMPKSKDPGWFVLDEAAAYFLTLGLLRADSLLAIVAGFLTFRFYDIAKPWPVRSFEQIPGSLGILMDDLAAAVLAAWTWHAATALGLAIS